jgi:plastocyanin
MDGGCLSLELGGGPLPTAQLGAIEILVPQCFLFLMVCVLYQETDTLLVMDCKKILAGLLLSSLLFCAGCVQEGSNGSENDTIIEDVIITEASTSSVAVSSTTTPATTTTLPPATTTTAETTTTTSAIAEKKTTVLIKDRSFIPENITIRAGTIVTWLNNDSSEHQIISDIGFAGKSGGFTRQLYDLKSPRMFKGSTYSYRFQRAGNYTYHCNIYPNLRGSVQVLS